MLYIVGSKGEVEWKMGQPFPSTLVGVKEVQASKAELELVVKLLPARKTSQHSVLWHDAVAQSIYVALKEHLKT
jgi:hypothetical protein